MSIAAIHPPVVVYREEQNFGLWVYTLLSVMMVGAVWFVIGPSRMGQHAVPPQARAIGFPYGLAAVGLLFPPFLWISVLRMTTEVVPGTVRIWFGWVPTYRRVFDLSSVTRVEVVRYRPLRDCWGWGVRPGRDGERVFNARGDRGVRLYFADGSKVLIGSQRPEPLAVALEQAMRPQGL